MIYKIISNNNDLATYIPSLKENFNILLINDCLYLAQKTIKLSFNLDLVFKNRKNKRYFILEINENNLNKESNFVIEWCKNQFIQIDLKKFEQEQQEYVREAFSFLETFETELKKIEEEENKLE